MKLTKHTGIDGIEDSKHFCASDVQLHLTLRVHIAYCLIPSIQLVNRSTESLIKIVREICSSTQKSWKYVHEKVEFPDA